MKAIILASALSMVISAGRSSPAHAGGSNDGPLHVHESRNDSSVTEGETILAVDPDAAYVALTDYARWTSVFPDLRQVIVTHRTGDEVRITCVHRDGHRDNLHVRNQPAARMVWFEDTGGRAEVWAEIVFVPGDRAGTTRVHSRLYADVHGLASLVVSDGRLRRLREQRVRADLLNLRNYFAQQSSMSRAAMP